MEFHSIRSDFVESGKTWHSFFAASRLHPLTAGPSPPSSSAWTGSRWLGFRHFAPAWPRQNPVQQVSLGYLRKGKTSTASVTLGERPPDSDPGPKVEGEAGRLIKESIEKVHQIRRGVVVDGTGKTHVIENGDPFEILLNDPNVPEEMKGHLWESRKLMKRTLPDETAEETYSPRETGAPE
jgi:hypothetical protein